MELIDTHTHLYLKEFDEDRTKVIKRAIELGIKKMILPNIDKNSVDSMLELCRDFPENCYPCIGLHPTSVKANYREELAKIKPLLQANTFYAIGEIGIDLYWDKTYKKEQQEALAHQFDLAINHQLPVIIHSRNSLTEIFEVLNDFKNSPLRGIFHCFSGKTEDAEKMIEKNFLLGIGGVVTYKNSELPDTLKKIDINYLVLETDSPYLPPVPYRGKRNESAYLIEIAKKIADIKNLTVEKVAEITTNNAKKLFQL